MIKEKIIRPQTCDMGSDYREYEITEIMSLESVLDWIEKNISAWGTITITWESGEVLRKFDYDLYLNLPRKNFYHHLSWEYSAPVLKMTSSSCFMEAAFEIQIGKKLIY